MFIQGKRRDLNGLEDDLMGSVSAKSSIAIELIPVHFKIISN